MDINIYCREVLEQYPEYVSKEQMYKVCHIRKSTCLFLLENKLVPCLDNGKTTHRFKIRTKDIVAYLKDREVHPEKYKALSKPKKKKIGLIILTDKVKPQLRTFYEQLLENQPDVMDAFLVSGFTGYELSTVAKWCSKGALKCFMLRHKNLIPKEYLLDFLVSDYYVSIRQKSRKNIQHIKNFGTVYRKKHPERQS